MIHAKNLTFHNTNFLWSSFMFQTQYNIQRACDHPTTSPGPKGSVKNIWGKKQSVSTSWHQILCSPFDSFLFPPVFSWVARLMPLESHFTTTPRGWESPSFDARRSALKEVSRAAWCDTMVIISDEIINEKMLGKS